MLTVTPRVATRQRQVKTKNVFTWQVTWPGNGVEPGLHHKDHGERVTNHFYHTTRALVDRNMLHYDRLATDTLYHEVVTHWAMVAARCQTFVGREVRSV